MFYWATDLKIGFVFRQIFLWLNCLENIFLRNKYPTDVSWAINYMSGTLQNLQQGSVNQDRDSCLHQVCILVRGCHILKSEHSELIKSRILRGHNGIQRQNRIKGMEKNEGMRVGGLYWVAGCWWHSTFTLDIMRKRVLFIPPMCFNWYSRRKKKYI